MFSSHLRKMSIVLLLGGVVCVCLLTQLVYSVVQVLLTDLSDFLLIIGSGVLILPSLCCYIFLHICQ